MTTTQNYGALVNTADPRQDVHKERQHDPNQHRYAVTEALLPQQAEGLSVLDVGGGIGEMSRRLAARGMKVTFTDLSQYNIRRAQSMGFRALHVDLNNGLRELSDAEFDGVVILEVIEHVVAAEQLLAEIARVLKPGGFLILSTPNFTYFLNRLRILFGGLSHDEGYHYRFFTVKSLAKQLRQAGLEVVKARHTTPAIGLNILRRLILKKPRLHVAVPNWLAPLFSYTLVYKAVKK